MRTTETTTKSSAENSALVTELRGICGWDFFNDDSFTHCLVGDEALELEETPIINPIIHHSATMFLADSFQVFHYYTTTTEGGDYPLAHIMVYPSHVTGFSTTQAFEKTLSAASAFDLKNMTKMFILPLDAFDCALIIKPAVTGDGEVVYSEVNAQNTLRSVVSSIDLSREYEEKERSSSLVRAQEAFLNSPILEVFSITSGDVECDFHDALQSLEFKHVLLQSCASWEVIPDTRSGNDWLSLCLFDSGTGLFNARDCELRRQPLPDVRINEGMELDVITNLARPCLIDAILLRFHECPDSHNYIRTGWNLDFSGDGASHIMSESHIVYKYCEEVAFPHRNKIAVSPCDTKL